MRTYSYLQIWQKSGAVRKGSMGEIAGMGDLWVGPEWKSIARSCYLFCLSDDVCCCVFARQERGNPAAFQCTGDISPEGTSMFSTKLSAVGVAGAASLALVLGTAGTAAAQSSLGSLDTGSLGSSNGEAAPSCATNVLATAADHEGWDTPEDETPAEFAELQDAATTGAPAGPGALAFPDDVAPNYGTSLYKAVGAPLKSLVDADGNLTPIGFSYFSDDSAPALQLRITKASYYDFSAVDAVPAPAGEGTHFPNGFATIVFSPANSDKKWKTLTPEQVAESADFWVTKSIAGTDGVRDGAPLLRTERASLKDIIAMNPDAQLDAIGVQKTRENDAQNTYIDNFVFGCETTDFEKVAPAPAEDPSILDRLKPFIGSLDFFGSIFGDDEEANA